jgi:hypothetical protein
MSTDASLFAMASNTGELDKHILLQTPVLGNIAVNQEVSVPETKSRPAVRNDGPA